MGLYDIGALKLRPFTVGLLILVPFSSMANMCICTKGLTERGPHVERTQVKRIHLIRPLVKRPQVYHRGPFNNYIERFSAFFDHLPTPRRQFIY